MQLTKGSLATRNPSNEELGTRPVKEGENTQIAELGQKPIPSEIPTQSALAPKSNSSDLVINHLAGKVFKMLPDLVTHIPRFSGDTKDGIKFGFRNLGDTPREVEIQLSGPVWHLSTKAGSAPMDVLLKSSIQQISAKVKPVH